MTHDLEILDDQKSDDAGPGKSHDISYGHAHSRLLRFEMLETRRLMAADLAFTPPVDFVAVLTPSWQYLGTNTLPATDVPGALPTGSVLNAATPWTAADASPFSYAVTPPLHTPSLEAGVLGNFAQLWRGGYGAIPEVTTPPEETKTPERPQAGFDVDEDVLDAIVVSRAPMIGSSHAPTVDEPAAVS